MRFGFYCPNEFTKEKSTKANQALQIVWPEKPMLEYLCSGAIDSAEIIEPLRKSVLAEYRRQAEIHSKGVSNGRTGMPANYRIAAAWQTADWTAFLQQIDWKFGAENAENLRASLYQEIQSCNEYSEALAGKEDLIIAQLLDLLDQRQSNTDFVNRFVHTSEILLVFKAVEAGSILLPDPAWQAWESLPSAHDSRNLSEKMLSVCPGITTKLRERWERRAANSLIEQRTLVSDRSVLALKYHIYDACEEMVDPLKGGVRTQSELEQQMSQLLETAVSATSEVQKQYAYRLKSTQSIEGIVYELFDSCYLSFDEASNYGNP